VTLRRGVAVGLLIVVIGVVLGVEYLLEASAVAKAYNNLEIETLGYFMTSLNSAVYTIKLRNYAAFPIRVHYYAEVYLDNVLVTTIEFTKQVPAAGEAVVNVDAVFTAEGLTTMIWSRSKFTFKGWMKVTGHPFLFTITKMGKLG